VELREDGALELEVSDQEFAVSSLERAILLAADTRGQFRCGIPALPKARAGAAPDLPLAARLHDQGARAQGP